MSVAHLHFRQLKVEDRLILERNSRVIHRTSNGLEMIATGGAIVRANSLSSRNAPITGAVTLMQQVHEGRTLLLQSAVLTTVTLPTATGSGSVYKFIVGAVNAAGYVIKAAVGTNLLKGTILQTNSGASGALRGWSPAATDDTITLNSTTTGGAAVGDFLELQDIGANLWAVRGSVTCTGTAATPYSDTVA